MQKGQKHKTTHFIKCFNITNVWCKIKPKPKQQNAFNIIQITTKTVLQKNFNINFLSTIKMKKKNASNRPKERKINIKE